MCNEHVLTFIKFHRNQIHIKFSFVSGFLHSLIYPSIYWWIFGGLSNLESSEKNLLQGTRKMSQFEKRHTVIFCTGYAFFFSFFFNFLVFNNLIMRCFSEVIFYVLPCLLNFLNLRVYSFQTLLLTLFCLPIPNPRSPNTSMLEARYYSTGDWGTVLFLFFSLCFSKLQVHWSLVL